MWGLHYPARVRVGGVAFDRLTTRQAAGRVREELGRHRGGLAVVVDQELTQQARADPATLARLDRAELVLAGTAGAVWGSRVAGTPVPTRVDAAELVDELCAACVADGRQIHVVGGAPGRPGIPGGAQRVAAALGLRHVGLMLAAAAGQGRWWRGVRQVESAVARRARELADVVAGCPDVILLSGDLATTDVLRESLPSAWVVASPHLVDRLLSPGSRTVAARPAGPAAGRWAGRSPAGG